MLVLGFKSELVPGNLLKSSATNHEYTYKKKEFSRATG